MKKATITLFLLIGMLFGPQVLSAQQLPIFTQYREYYSYINPAVISDNYFAYGYNTSVSVSHRSQWAKRPLTPQTQMLKGSILFPGNGSAGFLLGGHLINDQTGPTGFTGAYLRAMGFVGDPDYGGVALGFNLGGVQYRLKASDIILLDGGDVLGTQDQRQFFMDVGAGLFAFKRFRSEGILYGGLSVPQLFQPNLTFKAVNDEEFTIQRVSHFYGLIGFFKQNPRDFNFFEISAWFKYVDGAPFNVDINIRRQIQSFFWLGAGYNTGQVIHLETGFIIGSDTNYSRFKIGYGADVYMGSYGSRFGPAHEINLTYMFYVGG